MQGLRLETVGSGIKVITIQPGVSKRKIGAMPFNIHTPPMDGVPENLTNLTP